VYLAGILVPLTKLLELSLNAKPLEELLLLEEELLLDSTPLDELLLDEEELLEELLEELEELEELEDELLLPGAAVEFLRSLPHAAVTLRTTNKGATKKYFIGNGLSDWEISLAKIPRRPAHSVIFDNK
jgi:hypothetical protein